MTPFYDYEYYNFIGYIQRYIYPAKFSAESLNKMLNVLYNGNHKDSIKVQIFNYVNNYMEIMNNYHDCSFRYDLSDKWMQYKNQGFNNYQIAIFLEIEKNPYIPF